MNGVTALPSTSDPPNDFVTHARPSAAAYPQSLEHWHVHIDGKTYGPYVLNHVAQMVERHQIFASDLVYAHSRTGWIKAESDPVLSGLFRHKEADIISQDAVRPAPAHSHNANSSQVDLVLTPSVAESSTEAPPPSAAAISLSQPSRGRKIVFWLIIFPFCLYFAIGFVSGSGHVARKVVDLLNSEYGAVCTAILEGWGSDTLKVDWTSRTTKLHVIQVIGSVGTAKSVLYGDGVRYFKFPNDAGGYNIIDWKTGEKTSVSERAPYSFR